LSSWSHGSWIYNYLCNQYLSPLTLWVQIQFMAGVYLIQHYMIKLISDLRHVDDFLWGFPLSLSIKMTATIYSWNIIESGVKNPNPNSLLLLMKYWSSWPWSYGSCIYNIGMSVYSNLDQDEVHNVLLVTVVLNEHSG
jgi:hypothetical protein